MGSNLRCVNDEACSIGKFRTFLTFGVALGFLLAFGGVSLHAQKKGGGGGGGSSGTLYRVTMTTSSPNNGVETNCPQNDEGYVLATLQTSGGASLHTNGSEVDPVDGQPVALFLDFFNSFPSNAVPWTRKYDAGRGTSGTFNGCFGETYQNATTGNIGYSGNLFINFPNTSSGSTVSFTWYFDYYLTPGNNIREHFVLKSGDIPFPAWTGGNISGQVSGNFDFLYYLKEGHTIVSPYVSLTGGQGIPLNFTLTITKVQ